MSTPIVLGLKDFKDYAEAAAAMAKIIEQNAPDFAKQNPIFAPYFVCLGANVIYDSSKP